MSEDQCICDDPDIGSTKNVREPFADLVRCILRMHHIIIPDFVDAF